MPRLSPEARTAQAHVGGLTLRAPRELSPEARAHWKRIVESRPADFFSEGNLQLLAQYCRTLVQLDRATGLVENADADGFADAVATMTKLNIAAIQLATKLRLTIQSALRGDYAKNNERAKPSPLLGGNVSAFRKPA